MDFAYTTTSPASGGRTRQKSALVYLPPGFDPDDATTEYAVLYLMHGLWGSQYSWMGDPDQPTPLLSIPDPGVGVVRALRRHLTKPDADPRRCCGGPSPGPKQRSRLVPDESSIRGMRASALQPTGRWR